jgi:hypothetical protein
MGECCGAAAQGLSGRERNGAIDPLAGHLVGGRAPPEQWVMYCPSARNVLLDKARKECQARLVSSALNSATQSPSMTEPDIVRSFWHGESLNPYLLLCLRSFVRQGCRVEVFSYAQAPGFPEWIVARDAREIVPTQSVLVYRKGPGAGSPSLHSNLFRFALLDRLGGWWIDTDVAVLRRPLPSAPYYFSMEADHFANSVVKFPKGHPLLAEGAERCRQASEDVTWGITGPTLFTTLVHHHKLVGWAVPAEQGCPFIWTEVPALFDPARTDEMMARSAKSSFVHLYCEVWRRIGIPGELGPPLGSFLDQQFRQSDLDLRFAARIDMRHLAMWATNERAQAEVEAYRLMVQNIQNSRWWRLGQWLRCIVPKSVC